MNLPFNIGRAENEKTDKYADRAKNKFQIRQQI